MCLISLSRGFCSPLFLYLLYHKFPDLSIVFSKKIKIFFTFSGLFAALPFSALVSKNCLNYQNLVNFGAWRSLAAIALKARPLQNKNARKSLSRTSFLLLRLLFLSFYFVNQSAYVFTVKYRSLFIDYQIAFTCFCYFLCHSFKCFNLNDSAVFNHCYFAHCFYFLFFYCSSGVLAPLTIFHQGRH